MDLNTLYAARFPERDLEAKDAVWKVLCEDFFQPMVKESDTVLDLGAGFGEFLRHIRCASRIAVDMNQDIAKHLPERTRLVIGPSWDLSQIQAGSINVALASNFFEHLPDKDKLLKTLSEINRVLASDGRLLILQPNLAYLHGMFFNFLDHLLPLTHKSMAEALAITGFSIKQCIPRFLPFTTRSRLPQHPLLVKIYLKFKPAWWIMGKQMFILAEKA